MLFGDGSELMVEERTGQAAVVVGREVVVIIVLSVVKGCVAGNAAVVVDRNVVDTIVFKVVERNVLWSTAVVSGKWVCETVDIDRSVE